MTLIRLPKHFGIELMFARIVQIGRELFVFEQGDPLNVHKLLQLGSADQIAIGLPSLERSVTGFSLTVYKRHLILLTGG